MRVHCPEAQRHSSVQNCQEQLPWHCWANPRHHLQVCERVSIILLDTIKGIKTHELIMMRSPGCTFSSIFPPMLIVRSEPSCSFLTYRFKPACPDSPPA